MVETAIELFSKLLPLQDLQSAQKILAGLLENAYSPKLEKNAGRKAAVWVNASVAIVLALREATSSPSGFKHAKETFGNPTLTSMVSPFLMVCFNSKEVLSFPHCLSRKHSSQGTLPSDQQGASPLVASQACRVHIF